MSERAEQAARSFLPAFEPSAWGDPFERQTAQAIHQRGVSELATLLDTFAAEAVEREREGCAGILDERLRYYSDEFFAVPEGEPGASAILHSASMARFLCKSVAEEIRERGDR